MEQIELEAERTGAERQRVEAVVKTLATLRSEGESLAEIAHDARNMVTALGLYCDLLDEPGVLAVPCLHYASELRLVAAASRHLVEKLVALEGSSTIPSFLNRKAFGFKTKPAAKHCPERYEAISRLDLLAMQPIESLAAEVEASCSLLSAVAGSSFHLTVDTKGAEKPVRLTREDLTRVLVNLVKNTVEASPSGGEIILRVREAKPGGGRAAALRLTLEDDGPGIPPEALNRIFIPGYSTRSEHGLRHRGLGLSITRSIIAAAGGRICAGNRRPSGARFSVELPVRTD